MKTLTCWLILIIVVSPCTSLCPAQTAAQPQSQLKTLAQLRAEIKTLEAVARDPNTSPEVLEINRNFLAAKTGQLRSLITNRKTALAAYLTKVKASLEPRDIQVIESSIAELEIELAQLSVQSSAASLTPTSQVQQINYLTNAATPGAPALERIQPLRPPCSPADENEKKDFIIYAAASGEPKGVTRFKRNERARIILKNKNPFLYQYRVTLEEKVIAETAVGSFLSLIPFVSGMAEPPKEKQDAHQAIPSTVQKMQKNFENATSSCFDDTAKKKLEKINRFHQDLLEQQENLKDEFTEPDRFVAAYNTQTNILKDKRAILHRDSSCDEIYTTATTLRDELQSFLQSQKTAFNNLSNKITKYKREAQLFQDEVSDFIKDVPLNCRTNGQVDVFEKSTKVFTDSANDLDDKLKSMDKGLEEMAKNVNNINTVLAQPNAFYEVYYRGEYDLPTNVKVKVERKSRTVADVAYSTMLENQTLNFGGRARFALAGGLVGSPFETFNFVRVPALVNGQQKTVVGVNRSSTSRILPMAMLHGRVFDLSRKLYLDGIHLSLGVTAKPNDEGTNVEYLVGPSFSFLEGRMFVTAGGYGGRTQRLEGNFTPGAEIPEGFSGELPVSQRFVWKPGFSLTYKIK